MDKTTVCDDVARDFQKHFNPRVYVENFMDPENCTIKDESTRVLKLWHRMLQQVPPLRGRLLDFGTGSCIISLAAASKDVSDIVASGYLESEREELKRWLRDEPDAINWTPCLEFAAALEGNGVTSADIASRIRDKVRQVLPCDVHSSYPLGTEKMQQFDAVTCQFILEGASRTKEIYKTAANNLSRLVKPGGRLLMLSALEAEYYMMHDHKMPALNVDTTFLESVFASAGFINISFQICEGVFGPKIAMNRGLYIIQALKCFK